MKDAPKAAPNDSPHDPIFASAANKHNPLRTLDEVIAAGLNPGKVHCCAVPDGKKIRGCPKAVNCAVSGFGREGFVPDAPAWGPSNAIEGTPGKGPEYVAWYQRTAEGHESEHATICWQFMGDPFDRMQEMHKTGEQIVVLGGPGTPILEAQKHTVYNARLKQNEIEEDMVERITPTFRAGKPANSREAFIERRRDLAERRRQGRAEEDSLEYADSRKPAETPGGMAAGAEARARAKASAAPAGND